MGADLGPWRREAAFVEAAEAPIRPLLDRLGCTAGNSRWGYVFRKGLVAVGAADPLLIADATGVGDAVRSA